MPDHLHLLLEGETVDSDADAYVSHAKQASGYWFSREYGERLWQKSSWDRVLRSNEHPWEVIRYMFDNPVRAGLVERAIDYPYSGSLVYEREELFDAMVTGGVR